MRKLLLIPFLALLFACQIGGEIERPPEDPGNKEPLIEYKGETFLKKLALADVAWISDLDSMQYHQLIILTLNDSDTNLFSLWYFNDEDCFNESAFQLQPSWDDVDQITATSGSHTFFQTPTKLEITENTTDTYGDDTIILTRVFTFELINKSIIFSYTSHEDRNGIITTDGGFLAKYDDLGVTMYNFNQYPKCDP